MEDDYVNTVIDLCKVRKWKEIVDKFHDYPGRSTLLWVFPNEENFIFLNTCLEELNCDKILSIGCGSGLLEWLIYEATGKPVSGLEVDRAWWQRKHAPPTFIPLLFTASEIDTEICTLLQNSDRTALMFCYFNNRPAFDKYLKYFSGKMLIIIGPGVGKGVHADPMPFPKVSEDWTLYKFQEVRSSKDFIAVYFKNNF